MDRKLSILLISILISGFLYVTLSLLLEETPQTTTTEENKLKVLECNSDAECGISGFTGIYDCRNNNVYGEYRIYMCAKIDDQTSKCAKVRSMELIASCDETEKCVPGSSECMVKASSTTTTLLSVQITVKPVVMTTTTLVENITCFRDSNCGLDHYSKPYCTSSGHSVRDYVTYKCVNPGTYGSKCSREKKAYLVDYCGYGEACLRGECVDKSRLSEYCLREDCCATDFDLCGNYSVQLLPFPVRGTYNNSFVEEHNTTIYM